MLGWYQNSTRLILVFCCYMLLVFVGLTQIQLGAPEDTISQLRVTVIIRHYGVDATEMERSIGIPLENAVSNLQGTAQLRTQASMNQNRLDIELLPETNLNEFYLELREVCDRIYQSLPRSVQKPEIFYSSARDQPFYIVAIQDYNLSSLEELRQLIEYNLKPLISRVPGVGEIQVGGGEPREIHIEMDQDKLSIYQISPFEVQAQLQNSYRQQGVGQIRTDASEISVVFDSRFTSLDQLRAWHLTLQGKDQKTYRIPLGQLAEISYQNRETESISRINNKRSIVLYLKPAGTNSVIQTAKQVEQTIDQWLQQFPYQKQVVYNLGRDLRKQLQELFYTTLLSMLIIVIFIFWAYKNFTQALISGSSILLSCLSALALFGYLGFPLNFESLSIINISIGLIADVSILLNIAYRQRLGRIPALKSVIRLFPALLYSTFTSLIVAVPLILQRGNFRLIGSTFSLIISIATVSNILFLPGFLTIFDHKAHYHSNSKNKLQSFFQMYSSNLRMKVTLRYQKFILWRRKKTSYIRILSLVVSGISIGLLLYLPRNNQELASGNQLFVYMGMPSGSHVDAVDNSLSRLSQDLQEVSGIQSVESRARRDAGTLSAVFDPAVTQREILRNWVDDYSAQMPEGFAYTTEGGPQELAIEVAIMGPNHLKNRSLAREVNSYLMERNVANQSWISHSLFNFQEPSPMVQYYLFPDRLQQYDLDSSAVSQKLRWALYGPVSLKWHATENRAQPEIDLRIMGYKENNYNNIRQKGMLNNNRQYVYFSDIGTFQKTSYIKNLYRQDRQKTAYFTIYTPILDAHAIYIRLKKQLREFPWPENYTYYIDSSLIKKSQESKFLFFSFLLSAILIYVILSILYESLVLPITVLLSIPLSITLPLILFWIFKIGISEQGFIALIICTGIQVNNIIFLVDEYIYNKKKYPYYYPHINILLGEISLRNKSKHILLTSFSTIFGQIPLLISGNSNLIIFSFTMIGGLLGSMLVSFLIIPSCLMGYSQPGQLP